MGGREVWCRCRVWRLGRGCPARNCHFSLEGEGTQGMVMSRIDGRFRADRKRWWKYSACMMNGLLASPQYGGPSGTPSVVMAKCFKCWKRERIFGFTRSPSKSSPYHLRCHFRSSISTCSDSSCVHCHKESGSILAATGPPGELGLPASWFDPAVFHCALSPSSTASSFGRRAGFSSLVAPSFTCLMY